jgi:hypothetical protein
MNRLWGRWGKVAGLTVALTAGLAGCGAASVATTKGASSVTAATTALPAARPAVAAAPTGWFTYHDDNQRTGLARTGAALGQVHAAWTSPTLNGDVYAEPLVWRNLVIVATEGDTIYALASGSGRVVWATHIGTPVPQSRIPCGDIDPEGITSTPVIDAANGRLFAIEETMAGPAVTFHMVVLDANTGHVIYVESAVPAGMHVTAQQARSALVLANGRVYASYGGLYGDCGSYHGWVVSVPAGGPGPLAAFQVPTQNEGAVWAPPGPSVDSAGNLYVATGNGSSNSTYDYGNSVIRLTPSLRMSGHFAPAAWRQDNNADADLGSTSPQLIGTTGLALEVGKDTVGYLLDINRLGGIGGQVFQAPVCFANGGDASYGYDVWVACRDGVKDVRVTKTGAGGSFRVVWTAGGIGGSPILAANRLWVVSGDHLYGLAPRTGQVVARLPLGGQPDHFVTPAVGDNHLLVGVGNTVQAFT